MYIRTYTVLAVKDHWPYGTRLFLDEPIRFLTTPTLRFPTWPVTPSKGLGVPLHLGSNWWGSSDWQWAVGNTWMACSKMFQSRLSDYMHVWDGAWWICLITSYLLFFQVLVHQCYLPPMQLASFKRQQWWSEKSAAEQKMLRYLWLWLPRACARK